MESGNKHSLTVVIPTCNRYNYLVESVSCVLNQSVAANEIIVINNGREHLPENLLPEQVFIIELEPFVGVSAARNAGATAAKSEYLAFLDDDDLWENDYLKKVLSLIENEKPDCIITRLDKLVDNTILPYKNADGKLDLSILFTSNPGIGGQSTIVRKESFMTVKGYDEMLVTGEDKSLVIDLLLHGFKVKTAPHIQAILRQHSFDRLTDSVYMEKGIRCFLCKYVKQMTFAQKNFNWLKIHYYRYKSEKKFSHHMKYRYRNFLHQICMVFDKSIPESPKIRVMS